MLVVYPLQKLSNPSARDTIFPADPDFTRGGSNHSDIIKLSRAWVGVGEGRGNESNDDMSTVNLLSHGVDR